MKQKLQEAMCLAKAVVLNFHPDMIASHTASVCWFVMLSFLPFMILLLSFVRFIPFLQDEDVSLNVSFIPVGIRDLLQSLITEIKDNTSSFAIPLSASTGLVSASTGFSSLIKGLNEIYRHQETRSLWRFRLMCFLYTIVFLSALILVLLLIVFGKTIYQMLSQIFSQLPNIISRVIHCRLWAVVVVLTLFFAILYNIVPNRKDKWYYELPGAFLASCMWIAFSQLYSMYIVNLDRFSRIYGSLTLIILLMIWLYSCVFIVFIGAYANVLLQGYISMRKIGDR